MPPLSVVDAFTDRPFRGNPAAVCVLDRWPSDRWLQDVGRELNLSETAFLLARSGAPMCEFVSRCFFPGAGINEDPVTGYAHCLLAEYWGGKLGKTEMTGYQASARGGVVKVTRRGDRVGLAGRAVTVTRGELL